MTDLVNLPPTIPDKRVQEAAEELRRLQGDSDLTEGVRRTLEASRSKAAEADRQNYAEAIRAGKEDPGTPNTAEIDLSISGAVRKVEDLRAAGEEVMASIDAQRDELERTAEKRVAKAQKSFAAAVEALVREHATLTEAVAFERWLEAWPEGRYWPGKFAIALPGVLGPHGDPQTFVAAVEGLRAIARAYEKTEAAATR